MRLLSSLAPVRLERAQGLHGPLELTLENGRSVVNSANANQSFGSLHRVWQRCFADIDLTRHRPERILLLGYGAGSVAHRFALVRSSFQYLRWKIKLLMNRNVKSVA